MPLSHSAAILPPGGKHWQACRSALERYSEHLQIYVYLYYLVMLFLLKNLSNIFTDQSTELFSTTA